MENPIKVDDLGGTIILGNTHMNEHPCCCHLLKLGGRFRGGFLSLTPMVLTRYAWRMERSWISRECYVGFFFLEGFGGSKHLITKYDEFGCIRIHTRGGH